MCEPIDRIITSENVEYELTQKAARKSTHIGSEKYRKKYTKIIFFENYADNFPIHFMHDFVDHH